MTRSEPAPGDLLRAIMCRREALNQLRILRRRRALAPDLVQNARTRLRLALTSLDLYVGRDPRASSRFAAVRFAAAATRVQTYFTLEALGRDRNAFVRRVASRRLAELNRDEADVDLDVAPAPSSRSLPKWAEEFVL